MTSWVPFLKIGFLLYSHGTLTTEQLLVYLTSCDSALHCLMGLLAACVNNMLLLVYCLRFAMKEQSLVSLVSCGHDTASLDGFTDAMLR